MGISIRTLNHRSGILLFFVFLLCSAFPAQAELDDDFSHMKGLGVFRIADKELDNYQYESARYQYETILNGLAPTDTLARIYGISKLAKTVRRTYDLKQAWLLIEEAEALALPYFRQDHPVQAFLYHEKGELAGFYSRFVEAEKALKKALEIRNRLYGPKHCMTAFTVKELGEFYFFWVKDYSLANPLLRESFAVLDACLEGNSYAKALAYYDLACVYWRDRENQMAAEMATAALDILLACPVVNWDFVPYAYNLLAIIAETNGDIDRAIDYSLQALVVRERYRPDNKERIVSENYHLASYQATAGRFDEAIASLNKALKVYRDHRLNKEDDYASLILFYGEVYGKKGDMNQCMRYYNEGIKLLNELYGACHFTPLIHYKLYANFLVDFGKTDSAEACYSHVIDCLENQKHHSDAHARSLLSETYFQQGSMYYPKTSAEASEDRLKKSLSAFARSDSIFRILKSTSQWSSSVLDFNEYSQDLYRMAIACTYDLSQGGERLPYVATAYQLIESNKSFLLYKSIEKNMELSRAGLPDSIVRQLERNEGRIQLLKLDTLPENRIAKLSEMEALSKQQEGLLSLVHGVGTNRQKEELAARIPTLADCRRNMAGRDCLLQYFLAGDEYYLLGVTRDATLFRRLGRLDSLNIFIGLISRPPGGSNTYKTDVRTLERLAHQLYTELIPEEFCKGKDLVISPDGALYLFPFGALVTSANGSDNYAKLNYLVNEYYISYAYSAAQYLKMRDVQVPVRGSLFGLFPKEDLVQAARESKFIRRKFRSVQLASERDDKVSIIEMMKNRAVIHVATHGKADPSQLGVNYIELYGDQKLYDYEIGSLMLNSRLVYLNACETNLGLEARGEGVFSMSKAFMGAGCPTVISSLWEIPDAASAELARNFYFSLNKKNELDASFAKSKRMYLSNANDFTGHPFYWSGVMLIGNDQPLDLQANSSRLVAGVTGFIFVLFLLGVLINRLRRGKYFLSRR